MCRGGVRPRSTYFPGRSDKKYERVLGGRAHWADVAYHKRSCLSTALCSISDGRIGVDGASVQCAMIGGVFAKSL